jgi:hypothetical protein
MKKIILPVIFFVTTITHALSPNEMLVIIGAVKYYNENCAGLSPMGVKKMNQGLNRFDLDNIPLNTLEKHPMSVSGYKTAKGFGCAGTKREAQKAGFGQYIY